MQESEDLEYLRSKYGEESPQYKLLADALVVYRLNHPPREEAK